MKYFNNPQTLEELKKQYKKLAMQYHPDRGGDTKTMQAVNAEYDELFKRLKDIHTSADGEKYTKQTNETPEQFRDIISKLVILEGIEIEIIGCWVWVMGNTYFHRETLKGLNFRYSKSKKAWYFHNDGYTKIGRKTFTLDEIRSLYGSERVTGTPQLKLTIA